MRKHNERSSHRIDERAVRTTVIILHLILHQYEHLHIRNFYNTELHERSMTYSGACAMRKKNPFELPCAAIVVLFVVRVSGSSGLRGSRAPPDSIHTSSIVGIHLICVVVELLLTVGRTTGGEKGTADRLHLVAAAHAKSTHQQRTRTSSKRHLLERSRGNYTKSGENKALHGDTRSRCELWCEQLMFSCSLSYPFALLVLSIQSFPVLKFSG
jgi:hypothetical protein